MRSIELFAGCGGLALGLSMSGFSPTLVVEYDAHAIATLEANKAKRLAHVVNWPISRQDVRTIDFRQYRRIDLISGGPPCQPFSIGGKHLGPTDERNMWPEAIRAVREVSPKAFIFENVRGLLRPAFQEYLAYIVRQLEYPHVKPRLGESWSDHLMRLQQHARSRRSSPAQYKVIARGINAADYGAPQKRHRTIIMGISAVCGDSWSFPAPTHSQEALVWSKYIDSEYWERHDVRKVAAPISSSEVHLLKRLRMHGEQPTGSAWLTVRDAFDGLPQARRRNSLLQGHWQHPGARTYTNHTGSDWDEPAKALKAGDHGVPGGENMVCNRWGNPRYFTIREMARLQCLPDSYLISGSWKSATRQLGNAVPTIVGKNFGRKILEIIG